MSGLWVRPGAKSWSNWPRPERARESQSAPAPAETGDMQRRGRGQTRVRCHQGDGGDMGSEQGSHNHSEVQLVSKEVTSKTFLSENSKRNWSANVNSRFGCSYNHNSIINYYFGDWFYCISLKPKRIYQMSNQTRLNILCCTYKALDDVLRRLLEWSGLILSMK